MTQRTGEGTQIFTEMFTLTSAAGATSMAYSMENCDKITFVCGLGTAAAEATAITPVFTAVQSADNLLSTNAAITGATAVVGPTTANQLSNARSVLITLGTAATGAQTLVINGKTLTFSTAGGATVATAMTFGSTEGSTVAEGLTKASSSLAAVINASTLSYFMTASTPSTASVRLHAKDTASTGIAAATTAAAAYSLTSEKAHSLIEILAEDLNSTSKYVGISISTVATSVPVTITVIKSGLRYGPYQSAQVHTKST